MSRQELAHHPASSGQLRCVWSGHPENHRSCCELIPLRAIEEAWRLRSDLEGERDGFFHVNWRGGVWLAYGVLGGEIRGVYCPTHRAQREARGGHSARGSQSGSPVWAVAV